MIALCAGIENVKGFIKMNIKFSTYMVPLITVFSLLHPTASTVYYVIPDDHYTTTVLGSLLLKSN